MTEPPIDVTAVVVSYGTRDETCAAIASFAAELGELRAELVVVDNDSPDDSAEAIGTLLGEVRRPGLETTLHALDENIGFGAACNLGAKGARGRYVLMLNPDTVVLDRAVARLVAFADAHPEARMWGGRTLHMDRTLNPASAWAAPTPWSSLACALGLAARFPGSALCNPEGYGGWDRESVREVEIVSGCFMLVERALWEQLGGFHPDFWMYGEDADISLRARAAGARPTIDPESVIIHIGGASERVREDQMVRLFKGKAQLYGKFAGPLAGWFQVRCLDLWALIRAGLLTPLSLALTSKRDSARSWRGILRRRGEWRRAYRETARFGGESGTAGAPVGAEARA